MERPSAPIRVRDALGLIGSTLFALEACLLAAALWSISETLHGAA